jgi:DNA-binding transcriptional ArsR family regulator
VTLESYDQLAIFSAVAQERSFTRAAARLGMSQPALSRAMRQLEERLGVRLLARTTRSVAPTEAGEHLLKVIAPRFEEIDTELALLSEFRDKPAGKLRITAGEHSAIKVLHPALAKLLPDHPDLNIAPGVKQWHGTAPTSAVPPLTVTGSVEGKNAACFWPLAHPSARRRRSLAPRQRPKLPARSLMDKRLQSHSTDTKYTLI